MDIFVYVTTIICTTVQFATSDEVSGTYTAAVYEHELIVNNKCVNCTRYASYAWLINFKN